MSFWKTFANISTVAATAFFLFGCSEKATMVESITVDQQVQTQPGQISVDEYNKQMEANKAVLDAIPADLSTEEETEIEPEEGNWDNATPIASEQAARPFSDVLNDKYGKGPMPIGKGGYVLAPSHRHSASMPSDSVVLALYKYLNKNNGDVKWCASDAEHTLEDLEPVEILHARIGTTEFKSYVEEVVKEHGGADAVLSSCR